MVRFFGVGDERHPSPRCAKLVDGPSPDESQRAPGDVVCDELVFAAPHRDGNAVQCDGASGEQAGLFLERENPVHGTIQPFRCDPSRIDRRYHCLGGLHEVGWDQQDVAAGEERQHCQFSSAVAAYDGAHRESVGYRQSFEPK